MPKAKKQSVDQRAADELARQLVGHRVEEMAETQQVWEGIVLANQPPSIGQQLREMDQERIRARQEWELDHRAQIVHNIRHAPSPPSEDPTVRQSTFTKEIDLLQAQIKALQEVQGKANSEFMCNLINLERVKNQNRISLLCYVVVAVVILIIAAVGLVTSPQ